MHIHMFTDRRWLCVSILIAWLVVGALAFAGTPPSHAKVTKQPAQTQQLTPEQRQLARQQARYYELQSEELEDAKGFWGKVKANPVSLLAVFGAFGTIFLGLLNYFQALRNQRDTQFYEALQRFGDQSPAVRSSAAGLLMQMALADGKPPSRSDTRALANLRTLTRSLASTLRGRLLRNLAAWYIHRQRKALDIRDLSQPGRRTRFDTVFDQLISGLLLEEDLVVSISIKDAALPMIKMDPNHAVGKLVDANRVLQRQLVHRLGRLFGSMGVRDSSDITDGQWDTAVSVCEYPSDVLASLAQSPTWSTKFYSNVTSSYHLWAIGSVGDRQTRQDEAFRSCGLLAGKLRDNVELLSCTIKLVNLGYLYLDRVFLANAYLTNANLQGAWLRCTMLQGSDLTGCKLQGARLDGANMDRAIVWHAMLASAYMSGVHAQRANFFGANLRDAKLIYAILSGADMGVADLREAILNQAQLQGVVFPQAHMEGAQLRNIQVDVCTDLTGSDWWTADFGCVEKNPEVIEVLTRAYTYDRAYIPDDPDHLNPSIRSLISQIRAPHE